MEWNNICNTIPTYGNHGKHYLFRLDFSMYYGFKKEKDEVEVVWDSINESFYETKTKKEILMETVIAWKIIE